MVRAQNVFSARVWAAVTMRSMRPCGSIVLARHSTSRASRNRSSTSSTGHTSAASHAISFSSSARVAGPELQRLADLLAVVLRRPAGQVILRELGRRHLHQPGDVLHGGLRNLFQQIREPALLLVELQQQTEAQPGRPRSCSPPGPSRRPPASSSPTALPATTLAAHPPLPSPAPDFQLCPQGKSNWRVAFG